VFCNQISKSKTKIRFFALQLDLTVEFHEYTHIAYLEAVDKGSSTARMGAGMGVNSNEIYSLQINQFISLF
jgi:hypothetical protein